MSLAYVVYDSTYTSRTILVSDIAQIIPASPADRARGIHQYFQMRNGTTINVVTGYGATLAGEVGTITANWQ